MKKLKTRVNDLTLAVEENKNKLKASSQQNHADLIEKLDDVNSKLIKANSQNRQLTTNCEELTNEVQSKETLLASLREQAKLLTGENAKLETQLNDKSKKLMKASTIRDRTLSQCEDLTSELTAKTETVDHMKVSERSER